MDTTTQTIPTFPISKARGNLSKVVEKAFSTPIKIVKQGLSGNVIMISESEYNRLMMLDDAYWSGMAKKARKSGMLGVSQTDAYFRERLKEFDDA